jgi:predicted DNA-binding antitoxin AbrB/MazE fold protein
MSQQFQAIYENGLLRPLGPLPLAEHQVVTVVIQPAPAPAKGEELPPEVIEQQQAAWREFFQEMERLPPIERLPQDRDDLDEDALIYEDD